MNFFKYTDNNNNKSISNFNNITRYNNIIIIHNYEPKINKEELIASEIYGNSPVIVDKKPVNKRSSYLSTPRPYNVNIIILY